MIAIKVDVGAAVWTAGVGGLVASGWAIRQATAHGGRQERGETVQVDCSRVSQQSAE